MFDAIRKHQKLLQFVLLLLILPALVLFGVSGYERGNNEQVLAKVGENTVTKQEFDQALQRQLEQFRQFAGAQADLSMFDTPDLRKSLLENLISRKAADKLAADSRVVVTDPMVQTALMAIPVLRGPDGKFDNEGYKARLSGIGQTPAIFEAQMKKDIAAQMIPEALGQSGFGPEAVRARVTALTEEVRAAKPLTILASTYAEKIVPTEDQLKAYFDKNQAAFKTVESAKIEYLVLNADAIAGGIVLNADDVKTYYQQNNGRYGVAERRRASHIFFTAAKDAIEADKKKAKDAAAVVLVELKKDPSKFAELAKAKSQDAGSADKGGDLDFVTKENTLPAIAEAAFKLTESQFSDVVQSDEGFHIIKLTAVQKGEVKPFESVKPQIEADLRRQQATKKFSESAEGFTNTVYEQGDSLKPAADKFKLVIQSAQGVSRTAPQPGAGPVLSNPKFLKALFADEAIKGKKNIEAIEIAPGQLASARIVDYTPAAVRPFADVKAEVTKRVQLEEGRKQATAAGRAKLKEFQGGAAASGFGDGVLSVSRIQVQGLSKPAIEAIFRASAVKFPAFVGLEDDAGYTVYQVLSSKVGESPEVAQRKAQIEARADSSFVQQEFVAFTESLKARSGVKRTDALIASTLGKTGDAADSKAGDPKAAGSKSSDSKSAASKAGESK
jgi:peptidyl-prolyl cis-trans isomerase D